MMQPIQLVTIAASAGGIPALRQVLSALPTDYPAAVAIVQHRSARQPDLLANVLSRSCRLPVSRVRPGERLQPGVVYLAPSRKHLVVQKNGTFDTVAGPKIHHLYSSANPLFETAADVMGPGVVAVVLTGGGSDATDGVQAVKAAGGTVIVQDHASSQCFEMPASAIRTGAVDYILPLDEIGPMLVRLTAGPQTNQSRHRMTRNRRWEMNAAPDQSPFAQDGQTLISILRAAHETWIEEVESYLARVTKPQASFWDRWTAVRYIADEFLGQYRRERTLVNELRPFLPVEEAESLLRQGDRIDQLQRELDRVGRRRGTARTVSVAAGKLLDAVRSWCGEVEIAVRGIRCETLPAEAQQVLAEFEQYTQIHA